MKHVTFVLGAGLLYALIGSEVANAAAANCASFAPDPFVTRNDLSAGSRKATAQLLLRFVHFTDEHITDDDGEAVIGASAIDPVTSTFESAQRFQEEYSDEVFNDMIGKINACTKLFPAELAIVTGDSADMTSVGEIRRFIDNLDGTFNQPSAFEADCPVLLGNCARFTGKLVADTQAVDPNPNSPLFKLLPSRTILQLKNTEAAVANGRAADGSQNVSRNTLTRAPGLPQQLRCNDGAPGCINKALKTPWFIAFGNHDGYVRGTVPLGIEANAIAESVGRHIMLDQHEFIDEFFYTKASPGPVGHGFNHVDFLRAIDGNTRNDGYYAMTGGAGKVRLIVLNTIIDGRMPRIPIDVLRNPFALSDGTIDAAQFAWMKAELAKARANHQLVLVFSHHPDLTFAEYGTFKALIPVEVTAAQLDAELASWPNVVAWVAGHTHRHRVRAFKVTAGVGSNGTISAPVACKGPGACRGFWQIETASLIDFPQEQRLIEVFDNGDGSGTIRGPVLTHGFEKAKYLAERDDRCQLYLSDPQAVAAGITEAGLNALCLQGGTRQGEAIDRNVELMFRMPTF